jgi:D-proline reductase (dithiol) PrdB
VGLIARVIEAAGVPTLTMTSAWDITTAVRPPRSAFVHHPLGHQTGRPNDLAGQTAIVRAALESAGRMERPGEIVALPFRWQGDDGWEERAYAPGFTPTGPDGKPMRIAR